MTNHSLLASIKKDCEFKMHFGKGKEVLTVTLSSEALTIREAIIEAIQKLNLDHQTNLSQDIELYDVFGARKSGKKKDGLPSFQKSQALKNTCLKHFYLDIILPSPTIKSKDSVKSIESEITMDSRPRKQVVDKSFFGCFFLRKGSLK